MKNTVTFETAVRLKEAGFPQPVPDFGQTWLAEKETIILGGKSKAFPTRRLCVSEGNSDLVFTDEWISENMVFAPTVIGILEQLPQEARLYRFSANSSEQWVLQRMDGSSFFMSSAPPRIHSSPHEAAALAYLETKNQK